MAEITREEIERLIADVRDHHIRRNMADNFPRQSETFALMRRLEVAIVGEPARIEAARREGEAAGIERAAKWHDDRIPGELVMGMNSAANADRAAADAIRSLAPATAEPSAPVTPATQAEIMDQQHAIGFRDGAEQSQARIAALEAEVVALREGLKDVLASLVATVSLLGRIPNARLAAPSNKMFEQMILDYEATIERARALLQGQGGLMPGEGNTP